MTRRMVDFSLVSWEKNTVGQTGEERPDSPILPDVFIKSEVVGSQHEEMLSMQSWVG